MSEDSLRKRYVFKLVGNFINMFLVVVPYVIIPRLLGPVLFGEYFFIKTIFENAFNALDSGASMNFYTKVTKHPEDGSLIKFIELFVAFVGVIGMVFTACVFGLNINGSIFPDIGWELVVFGLLYGFVYWVSEMVLRFVDAYGLTVRGEILRTLNKAMGAILILAMFFTKGTTVRVIFVYHLAISLSMVVGCLYLLRDKIATKGRLKLEIFKRHLRELWIYSSPLILYAFVGFLSIALDRWLIQKYYGSEVQGLFGLAYSVAALSFLFTRSMTPLFTRDIAKAYGRKDMREIRSMHGKIIPILFGVTAIIACFVSVNGSFLSLVFGGEKFVGSAGLIPLMALYPIHQTYGQLGASVFYGTERTRVYCATGIVGMLLGAVIALILMLPSAKGGMGLGANGLAIKMLLMQFIVCNVQCYLNSKFLKIKFMKYIEHQILFMGAMILFAYGSKYITELFCGSSVFGVFCSGVLYVCGVGALFVSKPGFFGVDAENVETLIDKFRKNAFT